MRFEDLEKLSTDRCQSIREFANEIGEWEPDHDDSVGPLAKLLKRLGKQLVDAGMMSRVEELEGSLGPSTHTAIIAHTALVQAAIAPLDHLEGLISGDKHEMSMMKEQWLRIINEVVPGNGDPPTRVSTNDDRDEWFYEQATAGKLTYETIRVRAKKNDDWEQLASVQAVTAAIGRYCKRTGKPQPPKRKK